MLCEDRLSAAVQNVAIELEVRTKKLEMGVTNKALG